MALSPEAEYDEVVRLVSEADTDEKAMAVGFLLGRIDTLSRELLAAAEVTTAPAAVPELETN